MFFVQPVSRSALG
jgi:hypothetical protein